MTKETVNKSEKNMYRYGLQEKLCGMYEQSKQGKCFKHLMKLIVSEENIVLAYRNICKSKGSFTAGVDGKIITDIQKYPIQTVVQKVRNKLNYYQPKKVLRTYIDKGNGKQRPLGIPSIWDRLIQQCVLQILEPICEAKFHERSNGFRPYRSAQNAVAQCYKMIQLQNLHYVVDIDIKGFFDNINHAKLIRQIWAMGIQDLKVLAIIKAMLKADILFNDIVISPETGTPQGGILSPLLSNIVLNELDWWVASQWETIPTRTNREYSKTDKKGNVVIDRSQKWSMLREKSKLKEIYIVRYADDFKIMCGSYNEAQRWYHATVDFLKTRLKLDISEEKSKVINLKKNSSTYLGFKIKVVPKGKTRYGYIAKTDMSDKAIKNAKSNLKAKIINIRKDNPTVAIKNYNSAIRGIQNYYCIATNIYNNLTDVNYALLPTIRIRLRDISKTIPFKETDINFQKQTMGIQKETKIVTIGDMCLLPLTGVHHRSPMNFSQEISNYTSKGREKIHRNLMLITQREFEAIAKMRDPTETIEFNDNSLSAYVIQQGNCYITGKKLDVSHMKCIRKKPLKKRGTNNHGNIIFINSDVYKAIFTREMVEAQGLLRKFKLNEEQWKKVNYIRQNYDYQKV